MDGVAKLLGVIALIALPNGCCAQPKPRTAQRAAVAGESHRGIAVRGLRAVLSPLKTHYAPGETLQFVFYLTNATVATEEREVIVEAGAVYNYHIRLYILNAKGAIVPYPGSNVAKTVPAPQGPEAFIRLGIGCTYGRMFVEGEPPDWHAAIAEPGVYRVYATFEATERGSRWRLRAWTGTLESNEVEVTVGERGSGAGQ